METEVKKVSLFKSGFHIYINVCDRKCLRSTNTSALEIWYPFTKSNIWYPDHISLTVMDVDGIFKDTLHWKYSLVLLNFLII